MNNVFAVGYGMSQFSQEDTLIENLLLRSTKALFDNTENLEQKDIDAVLVSSNDNTKYLSAILAELGGIQPKISHTVESLCNSGTNSLVSGYSYIASGLADVVLVVGADRFDSPGQILKWDKSRGEFNHPIFWASIFTKAYKRRFNISDEDLAFVPAKNHSLARDNPYAYSKKGYTVREILKSKKLTEDLRLYDCSRPCSGSSALLLASEKMATKFSDNPIKISGIGQKTNSAGFSKTPNFVSMDSTKEASQSAFKMSNCTPEEIDVIELHDAFSVCEPIALESMGFSEYGKGLEFVKELYETKNKKVNPRGGIIGSGHPLGATGIAQTIEIVQQLKGKANTRQISNTKKGLVHNMSAAATSSTVLILES